MVRESTIQGRFLIDLDVIILVGIYLYITYIHFRFAPRLARYCQQFNIKCPLIDRSNGSNKTCPDECKDKKICTKLLYYPSNNTKDLKRIDLASPSCGYQCKFKMTSFILYVIGFFLL